MKYYHSQAFKIHKALPESRYIFNIDMEDQIPEDVVKDRFNRLLHEVQTISAEQCAIHEGTVQTVLVECVNEHDKHLMTGRMSNNLLVHFPGDESLIGQLVDVHLDECKGFYYMGTIACN